MADEGQGRSSATTSSFRRMRRRAWLMLRRLARRFARARVGMLTAALAYYAAFSLGPLLLLLGGWLGSVLQARPEVADRYRSALSELLAPLLPEGLDSLTLIERSFEAVVEQLAQGTFLRGALSLLVLLWASSGFFASLQRALEMIFDVPETRGFLRTRAVALLLIGSVALVIAVELVGSSLLAWVWGGVNAALTQLEAIGLDVPPPPDFLAQTGPLRILLAILAFALCFRFLPRRASRWDGALLGALVSVGGLQVMRVLLPLLFDEARFNLVYGVVASLVVLLLWLYLALLLFLVGALVAAEASANRLRSARVRARREARPEEDSAPPDDPARG